MPTTDPTRSAAESARNDEFVNPGGADADVCHNSTAAYSDPHPTPWEWVQDSTDLRAGEARVLDADSALVGRFPPLTARRIVYAVNDSAQELNDLMRVAFEQGQEQGEATE